MRNKVFWVVLMSVALAVLASLQISHAEGTAQIAIMRADKTQVPFTVELALDAEAHERGLMFRKSLPKGQGMLFVYDYPTRRAFWMKDTLIPLDMLFFSKKGDLVFIQANAEPKSLAPLGPDRTDICTVLEIGGGEAKRLKLKVGDKLVFKAPNACE